VTIEGVEAAELQPDVEVSVEQPADIARAPASAAAVVNDFIPVPTRDSPSPSAWPGLNAKNAHLTTLCPAQAGAFRVAGKLKIAVLHGGGDFASFRPPEAPTSVSSAVTGTARP